MDDEAIHAATAQLRVQTADWLDTLTPEQLDAQSLCERWRVRDVAGHLCAPLVVGVPAMVVQVARCRFDVDEAMTVVARRLAATDTAVALREHAGRRLRLPFVGVHGQLTDLQVHNADMRVPLGHVWRPETAWAAESLRFLAGGATGFVLGKHLRGLRVVATDADVAWGPAEGAEVRGPAYELVLALCGRAHAFGALEGPGTDVLAAAVAP